MKDITTNEKDLLIENTIVIGSLLREKMDAVQKISLLLQAKKNFEVIDGMELSKEEKESLKESRSNVEYLVSKLSDPSFVDSIVQSANKILNSLKF